MKRILLRLNSRVYAAIVTISPDNWLLFVSAATHRQYFMPGVLSVKVKVSTFVSWQFPG